MGLNSNPSLLDSGQIVKRTFDSTNDAVRVVPAEVTSMAIEISGSDGDSVVAMGSEDGTVGGTLHAVKVDANGVQVIRADSISDASAELDSTSTGVVLGPTSCSGIKTFQIYAQVTGEDVAAAGITSNITARIDISPTASGDTFYQTATTLNVPGATALDAVVASSLLTSVIGQRVRLSLTANNLAGNDAVVFYIVGSSL